MEIDHVLRTLTNSIQLNSYSCPEAVLSYLTCADMFVS